jgi:hypothetical protein
VVAAVKVLGARPFVVVEQALRVVVIVGTPATVVLRRRNPLGSAVGAFPCSPAFFGQLVLGYAG